MLTSARAPMLGSLSPDRWGRKTNSRRNDYTPAVATLQRRAARKYELALLDVDVDDEVASPEPVFITYEPSDDDRSDDIAADLARLARHPF